MEHVGTHHPAANTSHLRKRRNMSSPKLSVYSARATSAGGLRGKPSDYDGLVLWRQNWLAYQLSRDNCCFAVLSVQTMRVSTVEARWRQERCSFNFADAVSAPCHATRASKSRSRPATDTPVWNDSCWDLTFSPLQQGQVLP